MTPTLIVSLIVAVIAALASIIAAFVSRNAASAANESARKILSINQQIAELDRSAEQLRYDYVEFIAVLTETTKITSFGRLLGIQEVFLANPLCSTAMAEESDVLVNVIQDLVSGAHDLGASDRSLSMLNTTNLRQSYREVMEDVASRRLALLEAA